MKRLWLLALLALGALLVARPSLAHDPFEITAEARTTPNALIVEATMARSTALELAAIESLGSRFEALGPSLFRVVSNGDALAVRRTSARITEEQDVEITTVYELPATGTLAFEAAHLRALPEGYTSAIRFDGGTPNSVAFKVLTATDPTLQTGAPPEPKSAVFRRFTGLGVEHILTGYDHLLFLAGVLLACRRLRSMLAIVSCFTVAHSITLILAALGKISVPAQIVEPLIAASIVFVGVENLFFPEALRRRLAVTFAFGLLHGLGFAALLEDLRVGSEILPVVLFSFNLGVELGQLALAALALPLLLRLSTLRDGARALRWASIAVSCVGAFWFFDRLA